MGRSTRELYEEARRLDPKKRVTPMRLLIETLDESEEGVEDAWLVEIDRRMADVDLGAVEAIRWKELHARLTGAEYVSPAVAEAPTPSKLMLPATAIV